MTGELRLKLRRGRGLRLKLGRYRRAEAEEVPWAELGLRLRRERVQAKHRSKQCTHAWHASKCLSAF